MSTTKIEMGPLREAYRKDSGVAPNYLRLLRIRQALGRMGIRASMGEFSSGKLGNKRQMVVRVPELNVMAISDPVEDTDFVPDAFVDTLMQQLESTISPQQLNAG